MRWVGPNQRRSLGSAVCSKPDPSLRESNSIAARKTKFAGSMDNKLSKLRLVVDKAVGSTPITDMHTHLYSRDFGSLLSWGIDDLLTYHYLVAEAFHKLALPHDKFFALSKAKQADLIWQALFVDNSPVSETCRGVLTVLEHFGLDVGKRNLAQYRRFFENRKAEDHVNDVFRLANIRDVVMTNDPFDPLESSVWKGKGNTDSRFHSALRLDYLLNDWENAWAWLNKNGYRVSRKLSRSSIIEIRRFLLERIERMQATYMAVSLPPDFLFPENSVRGKLIQDVVLPVAAERKIPLALMIGVKRRTNPALCMAGDSVGRASIEVVEHLCREFPRVKFLVTMLSRENQHELTVAANKFSNLMIFGCWWYLNSPSNIEMMTRQRMELLGAGFVAQNSDARVLDQLIYKWDHSRKIIADVLFDKYKDIAATGWVVSGNEVRRDVERLLSGNFWTFLKS